MQHAWILFFSRDRKPKAFDTEHERGEQRWEVDICQESNSNNNELNSLFSVTTFRFIQSDFIKCFLFGFVCDVENATWNSCVLSNKIEHHKMDLMNVKCDSNKARAKLSE